jgi:5'-3' exonuclease
LVYLIDASVYVFRAWHALPASLADADGQPTHALYGFARFLSDLIERRTAEHVAVAFDETHGGGLRRRLYPAYKSNREPTPTALRRQFALCREFCRHLGVAEFASADYEADDLIGALAGLCRAEGRAVTIVSCDKDLAQLVGPRDVLWDYAAGNEYRYEQIAARFGVCPERIADYLALRGDSVDNIPGVPGVGTKTAAALMAVFSSLDELFAALDGADAPVAEAELARRLAMLPLRGAASLLARRRAHRDWLQRARTLTRIACDAPLPVSDSGMLRRRAPDLTRLAAFCTAQGFGALLPRQAARLAGGPAGGLAAAAAS